MRAEKEERPETEEPATPPRRGWEVVSQQDLQAAVATVAVLPALMDRLHELAPATRLTIEALARQLCLVSDKIPDLLLRCRGQGVSIDH